LEARLKVHPRARSALATLPNETRKGIIADVAELQKSELEELRSRISQCTALLMPMHQRSLLMPRLARYALAVVAFALSFHSAGAEERQWSTIKGQVVWEGETPKQEPTKLTVDKEICTKTKPPLEEDFIINPKNKGVKNVFVWIRPNGAAKDAPFPKADIHPSLKAVRKEPRVIDIPCCKYEPHALAAQEGEKLIIKNSSKVAHNSRVCFENGQSSPLMPTTGGVEIGKLMAEPNEIFVLCSIHPWMKCSLRVFDHPYFAVTDDDGKFEIKLAPTGNYSVFVHLSENGWLNGASGRNGTPVKIAAAGLDMGQLKMKLNPR
jgi:hypothetical protein